MYSISKNLTSLSATFWTINFSNNYLLCHAYIIWGSPQSRYNPNGSSNFSPPNLWHRNNPRFNFLSIKIARRRHSTNEMLCTHWRRKDKLWDKYFFKFWFYKINKVSSCLSNVKVNSTKWTNAAHFAMASAARRHTNRCASAKRSRTCWRCKENANRTAFWSFNVLTISTTFLSKTV